MNSNQVRTGGDEDKALRPTGFDGFLGQDAVKENLKVSVRAARTRGEALDHVLLSGPPGLGKTTLANIIANEMGGRLVVVNAPAVKTKGELAALLTGLQRGDVLFLDEIHSLNPKIEEVLYPAMEDGELQMVAGNRAIRIPLESFTLIGATTRAGMLQQPLRDRFGINAEMQLYTDQQLASIVVSAAEKLGVGISAEGAAELSRRSRGTPRVALRLLRRVRDFAQAGGSESIGGSVVDYACQKLGVDTHGLDVTARRYLKVLCDRPTPTALKTATSLLGETPDVVENVVEPALLRLGFVEITPKGRVATVRGRAHLGIFSGS